MELIATVLFWVARIVQYLTIAAAALFFLRVIFKWANANPFSPIPYHITRLTEPYVRPLRSQFGGRTLRYDLMPLLVGIMVLAIGLFIASMIGQIGTILSQVARASQFGGLTLRFALSTLIILAGMFYLVALFLRVFMPMLSVGYANRFYRFVFTITEPLLRPLRRLFVAGMFDFSPLVAMFLVQLLTGILADVVAGG